ncbi:hypothetical protein, partial [Cohnella sp. OV330]|uniref:hypothetical protein n=1 Tax=Cohnella sp. OV330 TaxID=1855288 RepID=UPI001C435760
ACIAFSTEGDWLCAALSACIAFYTEGDRLCIALPALIASSTEGDQPRVARQFRIASPEEGDDHCITPADQTSRRTNLPTDKPSKINFAHRLSTLLFPFPTW